MLKRRPLSLRLLKRREDLRTHALHELRQRLAIGSAQIAAGDTFPASEVASWVKAQGRK